MTVVCAAHVSQTENTDRERGQAAVVAASRAGHVARADPLASALLRALLLVPSLEREDEARRVEAKDRLAADESSEQDVAFRVGIREEAEAHTRQGCARFGVASA